LNYDNITLVPRHLSCIKSRDHVDLSVPFGLKTLKMPVLPSPMDTVSSIELCDLLEVNGLLGCLPRTMFNEHLSIGSHSILPECIVSIGLNDIAGAEHLYEYNNIRYFLIDVANGFNSNVENIILELKKFPDVFIIAGNVASREGFLYLADLGVNAIRCGIGNGSVCETTINTGIGQGIVSTLLECVEASMDLENSPLLIADGGVKKVGDIAKALALGADFVMTGRLFAGTEEAAGDVIRDDSDGGKLKKIYRGSASYRTQKIMRNSAYYVEGAETLVTYKGSAQDILNSIDAGLRSAFSYMGAGNISEFKENCKNGISVN